MHQSIVLPSKPKVVHEEDFSAKFQIDGLYPGYGHTLGNSLRRIVLSSLPGAAITSIKIDGVKHEFSTMEGMKEDVINFILNLKKVRFRLLSEESQTVILKIKGVKDVHAKDIETPGQVEVLNPDLLLAQLTDKKAELDVEMRVEHGLGYVAKDVITQNRVDIGHIALDANFSPIRRVSYEVENMRVGDRTDFNRLYIFIETDGTITPREALEKSIAVMIDQLKAIVGFTDETEIEILEEEKNDLSAGGEEDSGEGDVEQSEDANEVNKIRIESLGLSARTENALIEGNIRTVGGLVTKTEKKLLDVDGIGEKGLQEVKNALKKYNASLKGE